jgi:hypothetical protein
MAYAVQVQFYGSNSLAFANFNIYRKLWEEPIAYFAVISSKLLLTIKSTVVLGFGPLREP